MKAPAGDRYIRGVTHGATANDRSCQRQQHSSTAPPGFPVLGGRKSALPGVLTTAQTVRQRQRQDRREVPSRQAR